MGYKNSANIKCKFSYLTGLGFEPRSQGFLSLVNRIENQRGNFLSQRIVFEPILYSISSIMGCCTNLWGVVHIWAVGPRQSDFFKNLSFCFLIMDGSQIRVFSVYNGRRYSNRLTSYSWWKRKINDRSRAVGPMVTRFSRPILTPL